jgi:transposase
VKPYVGRGKNDAKDAEAICEAMSRPRVRKCFVPIKSEEQAAAQMLLGTRDNLVKRRTQLSNMIRSYAAEFGVVVPKGLDKIEGLLAELAEAPAIPALAKEMFESLGQEFAELKPRLAALERRLKTWHRANELCRRLIEVPTIGPVGASLMAIKIVAPKAFASGRMCAAWVGLTPKDHSTAGKQRLGGITRAGDEALRATLVAGATAYIEQVKRGRTQPSPWLADLLRRKPRKLVAVALANKTMRIAWRLMVSGQRYDPNHVPAKRSATPTKGPTAIAA